MLKKAYNVFRSMKFGMVLLLLIGILCFVAASFSQDAIYHTWYFTALFVLLALNLTACSVVRVTKIPKWKKSLRLRAEKAETMLPTAEGEAWLRRHGFRKGSEGWMKNSAGFFGTFLTHAGMLLLTVAAGCVFTFAETTDLTGYIGERIALPDGTELTVTDFAMTDDTGKVEYTSTITATLPDGTAVDGRAQVNYPVRAGQYKIYQQSYVYGVPVDILVDGDEEGQGIVLEEPVFLSLDGENGVRYEQTYGNVIEKDGEVLVAHSDEMVNPAYEVTVIRDGQEQVGLVYPGTTLFEGGVYYTFGEPIAEPGLRIKTQPDWAMTLLYLSFVMMIVGLYFCFFTVPEAASLREDGVAIVGQKDISQKMKLYQASVR